MIGFFVFLATLLEGEFLFGFGVYLAIHTHIDPLPLLIWAFFGAFLGDLLCFEWGKRSHSPLLARYPKFSRKITAIITWFAPRPLFGILLLRFQIGMRTLGCHAFGRSGLTRARFASLNLVACLFWATITYITWFYCIHFFLLLLDRY